MRVKEVMTAGPKVCMPETSLADAAALMWENDCGALPVVGVEGRVVGIITDRDICFGATTKNRPPSEVSVGEVITGEVFVCGPEDDIREALGTMRRERVRRRPVVADGGRLEGVLSMNDVVLGAVERADGKAPELTYGDAVETYKALCAHTLQAPPPQQRAATASSIMLFDEPTSGLDPLNQGQVLDLILRARDLRGISSLFVTKQLHEISYLAGHRAAETEGSVELLDAAGAPAPDVFVLLLHEGEIAFFGVPTHSSATPPRP